MPVPNLRQFRSLVARVVEALPGEFLDRMENLVIDVEEEPSEADLRYLERRDALEAGDEELFGLFHGVSALEEGAPTQPMNRIVVFRGAHVRTCRTRAELLRQVRATVLHELAHHFGYDEDDLADFEARHGPADDD
jgi:predicted Zn-dependent protease with MMP-like domain